MPNAKKTKNCQPIRIAPSTRTAIRKALRKWYAVNQRDLPWRRSADPYAIWISEVMLQQTQVKTATPYYYRFIQHFPDVYSLARADLQSVLKHWEGLGYYSRARNLHRAAGMVVNQMSGHFPDTWELVRQLPGIGDYIASALLSIAFNHPHAVVDGNVKRVLARLFRLDWPVNQSSVHRQFQDVANQLLNRKNPGDHNQAMMELGALVCTPRQTDCSVCPLSKYCWAFKENSVADFPKRNKRAPLPVRQVAMGIVQKRGRTLLVQRQENGMLGGLWEFPGGEADGNADLRQACRQRIKDSVNLDVAVEERLATVSHTYTHFKLQMAVYLCRWQSGRVRLKGPAAFRWVAASRIPNLPLHGAMHKALREIPLLSDPNF